MEGRKKINSRSNYKVLIKAGADLHNPWEDLEHKVLIKIEQCMWSMARPPLWFQWAATWSGCGEESHRLMK